jgi:aspartate 1-decarboxylase
MLIPVCTGKIHRATVTEANLDYTGSITICARLMNAARMVPYQLVHINSVQTAQHWETYVIPGRSNQICLNGPPARLFQPGDQVIILSISLLLPEEVSDLLARGWKPVMVDRKNNILPDIIDAASGMDYDR